MNWPTLGPLRTIHLLLQPFITRSTVWTSVCGIEDCRKFLWDFILNLFSSLYSVVVSLMAYCDIIRRILSTHRLSTSPTCTYCIFLVFFMSLSHNDNMLHWRSLRAVHFTCSADHAIFVRIMRCAAPCLWLHLLNLFLCQSTVKYSLGQVELCWQLRVMHPVRRTHFVIVTSCIEPGWRWNTVLNVRFAGDPLSLLIQMLSESSCLRSWSLCKVYVGYI